MSREEVYKEIQGTFGLVPVMFTHLPDRTLEAEWKTFKASQLDEGPIPGKYRELIGLAIAASTKCKYCAYFHTELAKLHGATEAELEDAVHYAKHSAGWSTYVHGMQVDYDQFKREIDQAVEYVRKQMSAAPAEPLRQAS